MFSVSSEQYDLFMGRYSKRLAPLFAEFAGVHAFTPGMKVLDVGCGPGALTGELTRIVRAENVAGIDPTQTFIAACRERWPGSDLRLGDAESLPWPDATFDAALSQLVLAFMRDPQVALREMRRVVRPGGVVAACMWEMGENMQLTDVFWKAAALLDPSRSAEDPTRRYRTREEIYSLWREHATAPVEMSSLRVVASYADFDDFWSSVEGAAGTIGQYISTLNQDQRAQLSDACRHALGNPNAGFELSACAWAARTRI